LLQKSFYTRALLDSLINEEKFHVQLSTPMSGIAIPDFPFNLHSDGRARSSTEWVSLSQCVTIKRAVENECVSLSLNLQGRTRSRHVRTYSESCFRRSHQMKTKLSQLRFRNEQQGEVAVQLASLHETGFGTTKVCKLGSEQLLSGSIC
jgi:hypothetical protein